MFSSGCRNNNPPPPPPPFDLPAPSRPYAFCPYPQFFLLGRSRPLLLRISFAHAIHWSRACHVVFKRVHQFKNSTKHRADDLCVNLVCEYFCWMLGDPNFFFGIPKNKKTKKICVWEVLIISHILLKKGRIDIWIQVSVTYKLYFLRLILADLMTYVAKIYQISLYKPC